MRNDQHEVAKPQENSPLRFDAEFTASVIEHMNSDHAEACLLIVRELSAQSDALGVEMTDLDSVGMEFSVTSSVDKSQQTPIRVQIAYPTELRQTSQVRGMLVAMSKTARERAAR